ncbi:hypothetical protein C8F04DRAFT_1192947 [Mycena alexandri]|uniref:Uncharacterized protein n=1 Tax=Mycena alexandri TaxID=1745969 RepID=A0AAD6SCX6_9AGAR|nr:hypothetical protein C8F04DRAFT_1192947 [Mycena alexandri]
MTKLLTRIDDISGLMAWPAKFNPDRPVCLPTSLLSSRQIGHQSNGVHRVQKFFAPPSAFLTFLLVFPSLGPWKAVGDSTKGEVRWQGFMVNGQPGEKVMDGGRTRVLEMNDSLQKHRIQARKNSSETKGGVGSGYLVRDCGPVKTVNEHRASRTQLVAKWVRLQGVCGALDEKGAWGLVTKCWWRKKCRWEKTKEKSEEIKWGKAVRDRSEEDRSRIKLSGGQYYIGEGKAQAGKTG